MAELYRVKVRCERTIIVHAETSEEAQKIAEEYAENSARFGPAWREFQWIESHTVTLPFEVS